MQATVYTIGYHDLRLADLVRWARAWDTLVVDVRIKPWSRNPEWGKPALVARLGGLYLWLGDALGNLRYREADRDAIDLADEGRGIAIAARLLRSGSVCLLCLCPWEVCHRRLIASRLHDETGAPIHHLSAAELSPQGWLAL